MRYRYKQNLEKKRAKKRMHYSKNPQRERDRQKRLDPSRKWLYNKKYYQKNKKPVLQSAIKNHDIRKKIIEKYKKFWSKKHHKRRSGK